VAAAFSFSARITDIIDSAVKSDIKSEQATIAALKADAARGAQISSEFIAAKEDVLDGMLAARSKYHSATSIIAIRGYIVGVFSGIMNRDESDPYWPSAITDLSSAAIGIDLGVNRKLLFDALGLRLIAKMSAAARGVFASQSAM